MASAIKDKVAAWASAAWASTAQYFRSMDTPTRKRLAVVSVVQALLVVCFGLIIFSQMRTSFTLRYEYHYKASQVKSFSTIH